MERKKITRKHLDAQAARIKVLKAQEEAVIDKYSTNFIEWSTKCNKVNRLCSKHRQEIAMYNYDHGAAFLT